MDLQDKTAVVTGASRGIGRAIAHALAREGAKLVLTARDQQQLERVAGELTKYGTAIHVVPADMRDEVQIKHLIDTAISKLGKLEILINNAGLGYLRPVAELTTEQWDEMFGVNLRGVFIATREALPHLRAAGESFIVNVASLAGKNTFVNGGGYAATKWGLRAFSQCLMLEERQHGVRILVICPGSVATDFGTDERGSARSRRTNITQPEDVAESILAALKLPQRSMLSEIDLRPTNP